jgi:hypothetical protein
LVEWVREGGLHLQWRDRAGFDRLPCYAQLGTEGTYSVFRLRVASTIEPRWCQASARIDGQNLPALDRNRALEQFNMVDAARLFRERLAGKGS